MKIRKNIARFLTIGIMLNNVYFNANASNVDISNRYEVLKGECVTIDNSVKGELHEIEMFGNTIQDNEDSVNLFDKSTVLKNYSLDTTNGADKVGSCYYKLLRKGMNS